MTPRKNQTWFCSYPPQYLLCARSNRVPQPDRKTVGRTGWVEFVDITDINKEGLLYDDNDLPAIAAKFKAEKVDGLFFPHGNFGTEYEVARLAKEMGLPVLLWGPRDECPG